MPYQAGPAAFQRLAELTRLIIISAEVDPATVARVLSLGAVGYLHKEISAPELKAALERVAAGGVALSPTAEAALVSRIQAEGEGDKRGRELSSRELETLVLAANGKTNHEIAAHLGIGGETVKTHLRRAARKLGAPHRAAAVAEAVRRGWV
jgi:DNA-binding NarL/FixJ family response regulator